jgi:uncharacterized membrane protein YgcG
MWNLLILLLLLLPHSFISSGIFAANLFEVWWLYGSSTWHKKVEVFWQSCLSIYIKRERDRERGWGMNFVHTPDAGRFVCMDWSATWSNSAQEKILLVTSFEYCKTCSLERGSWNSKSSENHSSSRKQEAGRGGGGGVAGGAGHDSNGAKKFGMCDQ